MRGRNYPDSVRIKALQLLEIHTLSEVARQMKIPLSTVSTWSSGGTKASAVDKKDFVAIRKEKKQEFIKKAWEGIQLAQDRLNCTLADGESKISAKDLSTVLGTLYDKQALASNENTQNIGLNRKLEDFIKDIGGGE